MSDMPDEFAQEFLAILDDEIRKECDETESVENQKRVDNSDSELDVHPIFGHTVPQSKDNKCAMCNRMSLDVKFFFAKNAVGGGNSLICNGCIEKSLTCKGIIDPDTGAMMCHSEGCERRQFALIVSSYDCQNESGLICEDCQQVLPEMTVSDN